jgi:hypothetical protein
LSVAPREPTEINAMAATAHQGGRNEAAADLKRSDSFDPERLIGCFDKELPTDLFFLDITLPKVEANAF